MKKKLLAILLAVLIAGAGLGGYALISGRNNPSTTKTTSSQVKTGGTIQFSADKKQVTYTGETGKTALANLQALTKVDTKDSSYGTMVVGINGTQAQDSKNYWAFYVNGSYASEGAGTYKTKAGDKMMWKLEDITP